MTISTIPRKLAFALIGASLFIGFVLGYLVANLDGKTTGDDEDVPQEAQQAFEDYVTRNVEFYRSRPTNRTAYEEDASILEAAEIVSTQGASHPQNHSRGQYEEVWCVALDRNIPVQASFPQHSLLLIREGALWNVAVVPSESDFLKVGCTNWHEVEE